MVQVYGRPGGGGGGGPGVDSTARAGVTTATAAITALQNNDVASGVVTGTDLVLTRTDGSNETIDMSSLAGGSTAAATTFENLATALAGNPNNVQGAIAALDSSVDTLEAEAAAQDALIAAKLDQTAHTAQVASQAAIDAAQDAAESARNVAQAAKDSGQDTKDTAHDTELARLETDKADKTSVDAETTRATAEESRIQGELDAQEAKQNAHETDAGRHVPAGGTATQGLTKVDGTNGNTEWSDQPKPSAANVLLGQGAPDDAVGSDGFYYQDKDAISPALDGYGPKAGGVWPAASFNFEDEVVKSTTAPVKPDDATGVAGSSQQVSRQDHKHPLPDMYIEGAMSSRAAASADNKGFTFHATDTGAKFVSSGSVWRPYDNLRIFDSFANANLATIEPREIVIIGTGDNFAAMYIHHGAASKTFATNDPDFTNLIDKDPRVNQRADGESPRANRESVYFLDDTVGAKPTPVRGQWADISVLQVNRADYDQNALPDKVTTRWIVAEDPNNAGDHDWVKESPSANYTPPAELYTLDGSEAGDLNTLRTIVIPAGTEAEFVTTSPVTDDVAWTFYVAEVVDASTSNALYVAIRDDKLIPQGPNSEITKNAPQTIYNGLRTWDADKYEEGVPQVYRAHSNGNLTVLNGHADIVDYNSKPIATVTSPIAFNDGDLIKIWHSGLNTGNKQVFVDIDPANSITEFAAITSNHVIPFGSRAAANNYVNSNAGYLSDKIDIPLKAGTVLINWRSYHVTTNLEIGSRIGGTLQILNPDDSVLAEYVDAPYNWDEWRPAGNEVPGKSTYTLGADIPSDGTYKLAFWTPGGLGAGNRTSYDGEVRATVTQFGKLA